MGTQTMWPLSLLYGDLAAAQARNVKYVQNVCNNDRLLDIR